VPSEGTENSGHTKKKAGTSYACTLLKLGFLEVPFCFISMQEETRLHQTD